MLEVGWGGVGLGKSERCLKWGGVRLGSLKNLN